MQRGGNVTLPSVLRITFNRDAGTSTGASTGTSTGTSRTGRNDATRSMCMTVYAAPGQPGSLVTYAGRYDNWIGGERVAPVKGQYFENVTPITGKAFCDIARSTAEDVDLALDAAHAAAPAWGKTSATERSNILLRIADRMEANLELLAVAETWDNGKP